MNQTEGRVMALVCHGQSRRFYCGMALGFDVGSRGGDLVKGKTSQSELIAVIPHDGQEREGGAQGSKTAIGDILTRRTMLSC